MDGRLSELQYFWGYFFGGIGVSPGKVGLKTWLAELFWELAHKVRYPRFRYLYKVDLATLGVRDDDWIHGVQYETVNSYTLNQCFATLRRFLRPLDTSLFVDVGCGAGRVLHEAARRGFQSVVGIEISRVMCELCERNLSAHLARTVRWRVVNENIRRVDFRSIVPEPGQGQSSALVLFLNNPFREDIVKVFADKLDALTGRDTYILYVWKQYPELLLNKGFVVLHEERRLSKFTLDSFRLYHRGAAK